MTNLWTETVDFLEKYDKTLDDVLYIQGDDFEITKKNFETVAKDTEYDSGYGAQHVAKDLVLVGEDWWIERYEYDGSEWWEYKSIPTEIDKVEHIYHLGNGMWDTIKDLNKDKL